ncbi:hypothetical protein E4U21_002057 [Claviceps maximensis]|nr:hypothetical protein E4U21_002057 [Claviceps maximensis]
MDAGRDDRPLRTRKAAMEVESETRKNRELICWKEGSGQFLGQSSQTSQLREGCRGLSRAQQGAARIPALQLPMAEVGSKQLLEAARH